jgi:hypothetical protein
LHAADWKQGSELRADGTDTRLEVTKQGGLTLVGGELPVVIPDKPGLKLLGQKL